MQIVCTAGRSSISRVPACDSSLHGATFSTGSGYAADAAGSTPAGICGRALEGLTGMGAEAFARRAERELLATGERARKRTPDTLGQLTPQEAQISRLAAAGSHKQGDRGSAVPQPEDR